MSYCDNTNRLDGPMDTVGAPKGKVGEIAVGLGATDTTVMVP